MIMAIWVMGSKVAPAGKGGRRSPAGVFVPLFEEAEVFIGPTPF